jgi:hypothetical protein
MWWEEAWVAIAAQPRNVVVIRKNVLAAFVSYLVVPVALIAAFQDAPQVTIVIHIH